MFALALALAVAARSGCAEEAAAAANLSALDPSFNAAFLTYEGPLCNVVGCFSMQPPWVSPTRRVPRPMDPDVICTHFFLFTRKRRVREEPVRTWPEIDLSDRDWDPSRRTYFITHGLSSSSEVAWMKDMKEALLDKMDANVFLTDWSGGSAGVLKYEQAVANTRVVGRELARMILHLVNEDGSSPENIHLIGHSLGAHVSAYSSKIVKNIPRLTALDPAQPFYEGFESRVRLDVNDATFVEVVHTDAKPFLLTFGLGMIGKYGHVDYYINGGASQPGCVQNVLAEFPSLGSPIEILRHSISAFNGVLTCPHLRATVVYTEAIRGNCTFWGHRGNIFNSIIGFLTGGHSSRFLRPSIMNCMDDSCSPLALDNESYPARGSFVVPTAFVAPFCLRDSWLDALIRQALLLPWRLPWLIWRFAWHFLSRLPARVWHLLWEVPWSLVFAVIE